MKITRSIQNFWERFCESSPCVDPITPFQHWFFGNAGEMAHELATLVISGRKTATASLKRANDLKPENAPIMDGHSVVTDFDGNPICVIQTTEIRHLPFDEVDPQFAFDEGEGDRTLEYWRERHLRYFTREAAELGVEFNEKSIICCERFRLLFPQ